MQNKGEMKSARHFSWNVSQETVWARAHVHSQSTLISREPMCNIITMMMTTNHRWSKMNVSKSDGGKKKSNVPINTWKHTLQTIVSFCAGFPSLLHIACFSSLCTRWYYKCNILNITEISPLMEMNNANKYAFQANSLHWNAL